MSTFQQYKRKQKLSELRPFVVGDHLDGVSISAEDAAAGSPKAGDMIARNPSNHADKWLVAQAYFHENFQPDPIIRPEAEAMETLPMETSIGDLIQELATKSAKFRGNTKATLANLEEFRKKLETFIQAEDSETVPLETSDGSVVHFEV